MKIDFQAFPYELFPIDPIGKGSLQPRKGALLRFSFEAGRVGYSDCHPWPELGDEELQVQLERLKKGIQTPLTVQSLKFASMDAEARGCGKSLLDGRQIPQSHLLVPSIRSLTPQRLQKIAEEGFDRLKIKPSSQWWDDAAVLANWAGPLQDTSIKLRLDLNANLSEEECHQFLDRLGPVREAIEFVEDPAPWNPEIWHRIQTRWGVPLAVDRCSPENLEELDKSVFSVWVIKPAVQPWELLAEAANRCGISAVVTSYLDHPLGQVTAAWVASEIKILYPNLPVLTGGLLSHLVYHPNQFSKGLQNSGPKLIPPRGSGWGWDPELGGLHG